MGQGLEQLFSFTFTDLGEFCGESANSRHFRKRVRVVLEDGRSIENLLDVLIANGGRGKIYKILVDSYKESVDGDGKEGHGEDE